MADSKDFIFIRETEDYIYYTNDYFDSKYQVVNKKTRKMYELYYFGDDRMLIMNSGITYEDACKYEEYIDEYGIPNETLVDWMRGTWSLNDDYEVEIIESYIK